MKTIKTSFMALALCIAVCPQITSCSSDKDDEPSAPVANHIAGIYYGDLSCTVMGSESTFGDMTVEITATGEATVTVNISEFGEAPMNMPAISVDDVKVNEAEDSYSLASTEFSGISSTGKTYSGTLQGSATDDLINVQFSLNYGAMPMPLICSFTGSK